MKLCLKVFPLALIATTITGNLALSEDNEVHIFDHGALRVSENGHFLQHEDGTPFFYLGDTNWQFLHRATREEAEQLIKIRKEKGFTTLQTVISGILEFGTANYYGEYPFEEKDPSRPLLTDDYDYWDHVEYVVDLAAENGLYIGLLPCWRKYIGKRVFSVENVVPYAKFLGERFKDKPNIIWILGGDRTSWPWEFPMWDKFAAVLRESVGDRHLITFHPAGNHRQSSATWYHEKNWLDFNMLQSGHQSRDTPNYEGIERDYARTPVKPVMDGEPRYEQHSVNWMPENGWFEAFDVRQAAYWSVFAGACGHTYGCRGVWQMYSDRYEPSGPVRNYWFEEVHLEAGDDMRHVKNLILSRPYFERVPDQSMIDRFNYFGAGHLQITRGDSYVFVYSPLGNVIALKLGKISGEKVIAWWFNPRSGTAWKIGEFPNEGMHLFNPPGDSKRGNDWVLVLDDASKGYPQPGSQVYAN